jgi:hypothetical protein
LGGAGVIFRERAVFAMNGGTWKGSVSLEFDEEDGFQISFDSGVHTVSFRLAPASPTGLTGLHFPSLGVSVDFITADEFGEFNARRRSVWRGQQQWLSSPAGWVFRGLEERADRESHLLAWLETFDEADDGDLLSTLMELSHDSMSFFTVVLARIAGRDPGRNRAMLSLFEALAHVDWSAAQRLLTFLRPAFRRFIEGGGAIVGLAAALQSGDVASFCWEVGRMTEPAQFRFGREVWFLPCSGLSVSVPPVRVGFSTFGLADAAAAACSLEALRCVVENHGVRVTGKTLLAAVAGGNPLVVKYVWDRLPEGERDSLPGAAASFAAEFGRMNIAEYFVGIANEQQLARCAEEALGTANALFLLHARRRGAQLGVDGTVAALSWPYGREGFHEQDLAAAIIGGHWQCCLLLLERDDGPLKHWVVSLAGRKSDPLVINLLMHAGVPPAVVRELVLCCRVELMLDGDGNIREEVLDLVVPAVKERHSSFLRQLQGPFLAHDRVMLGGDSPEVTVEDFQYLEALRVPRLCWLVARIARFPQAFIQLPAFVPPSAANAVGNGEEDEDEENDSVIEADGGVIQTAEFRENAILGQVSAMAVLSFVRDGLDDHVGLRSLVGTFQGLTHDAVLVNDVDNLPAELREGASVSAHCCFFGAWRSLEMLVEEFTIDLTCVDARGRNLAFFAVAGGHSDRLPWLDQRNVPFDDVDVAAQYGPATLFMQLASGGDYQRWAFHACRGGRADILAICLRWGARADAELVFAAIAGQGPECLSCVIEACGRGGLLQRHLVLAVELGNADILRVLITKGLEFGTEAASRLVRSGGPEEILGEFLADSAASFPGLADEAALSGKFAAFSWLLANGWLPSRQGVVAAARAGHCDCADLGFMALSGDFDGFEQVCFAAELGLPARLTDALRVFDGVPDGALCQAIRGRSSECVRRLIERGVAVEEAELLEAVRADNAEILDLLLDSTSELVQAVLDIAVHLGASKCVFLLVHVRAVPVTARAVMEATRSRNPGCLAVLITEAQRRGTHIAGRKAVAVAVEESWLESLNVLVQSGVPLFPDVRRGVTDPVLLRILDLAAEADTDRQVTATLLLLNAFGFSEDGVERELTPQRVTGGKPAASDLLSRFWRKHYTLSGIQRLRGKIIVLTDELRIELDDQEPGVDCDREVSVFLALSEEFALHHFFLTRPRAPEYVLGVARLRAELDARLGPGNWASIRDCATYSFTGETGDFLRAWGVQQSEAFSRHPQDENPIELLCAGVKRIVKNFGPGCRESLIGYTGDAIDGASYRGVSRPLLDALPVRLQLAILLAGGGIPRVASGPEVPGSGVRVVMPLLVPPALVPSPILDAVSEGVARGLTRAELSRRSGIPKLQVANLVNRMRFFDNVPRVDWEDCEVLGIGPAHDGTPVVFLSVAGGRFADVEACHKLVGFPVLLEKVRKFARERWPPVLVGWAFGESGRHAIAESCPGGAGFAYCAPLELLPSGVREDVWGLPHLEVSPEWLDGSVHGEWLQCAILAGDPLDPRCVPKLDIVVKVGCCSISQDDNWDLHVDFRGAVDPAVATVAAAFAGEEEEEELPEIRLDVVKVPEPHGGGPDVSWFRPVEDASPMQYLGRGGARRYARRCYIDRYILTSEDDRRAVRALRDICRRTPDGGRLFGVGLEVLVAQREGWRLPSNREIARRVAVGVHAVGPILDQLCDANVDLFPILGERRAAQSLDRRGAELDLFFSGLFEWPHRVAVLGEVFGDDHRFEVARELAASVLAGDARPPSDGEIARLSGIGRTETVRLARNEVTEIWRSSPRDLRFMGDLSGPRRRGRPRVRGEPQ